MNFSDILRICKAYRNLGDAVGDQLQKAADGEPLEDMNPNALRMIDKEFLRLVQRVTSRDSDPYGIGDEAEELSEEINDLLEGKS